MSGNGRAETTYEYLLANKLWPVDQIEHLIVRGRDHVVGRGFAVNAIFPGGIATPASARIAGSPVSGRAIAPPILNRGVETRDIAVMALFLAGPQAEVITGQTFTVDAGFLLG